MPVASHLLKARPDGGDHDLCASDRFPLSQRWGWSIRLQRRAERAAV